LEGLLVYQAIAHATYGRLRVLHVVAMRFRN